MAPEPTDVDSQNFEEQNQIESTLALIKPDCLTPHRIQAIKDLVQLAGFELVRQKKFWFTRESASEFYLEHKDKPFFEELISYITCAPVMAFELRQDDAVQIWRKLLGPTDPEVARDTDVNSIRAMFGVDITKNAVHGSDSVEAAKREIEFVFANSIHTMVSDSKEHGDDTLFKSEYTLGMIKPDAVAAGHSDTILKAINYKGFEVLNFEKLQLTEDQVKEFYKDQKSKPFYKDLISFMTSGEVHVVLLKGINAVRGWREMMGPADVEVARITRPQSICALYGTDEVKNAIHGSESKEAANREITFFFPQFFESLTAGVDVDNTEAPIESDVIQSTTENDQEEVLEDQKESLELSQEDSTEQVDAKVNGEQSNEEAALTNGEQSNEETALINGEQTIEETDLTNGDQTNEETVSVNEEKTNEEADLVTEENESENHVESLDLQKQDDEEQTEATDVVDSNVLPQDNHVEDSEESSPPDVEQESNLEVEEGNDGTKDVVSQELESEEPVQHESDTVEPVVEDQDSKAIEDSEVTEEVDNSNEDNTSSQPHEDAEVHEVVDSDSVAPADSEIPEPSIENNDEVVTDDITELKETETHEPHREDVSAEESALLPEKTPEEALNEVPVIPVADEQADTENTNVTEELATEDDKLEVSNEEQTFVLIKPDVYGTSRQEDILQLIEEKKFVVVKSEEVTFSKSLAEEFYSEYKEKRFFENIVNLLTSAPSLAMVLEKENAVQEWRSLMGPANSLKAKFESHGSIRALYGTDSVKNAVHGSDSIANAKREIGIVFGQTKSQDEPEYEVPVSKEDSHTEADVMTSSEVNQQPEDVVEASNQEDSQAEKDVATPSEEAVEASNQEDSQPAEDVADSQPQEVADTEIQNVTDDEPPKNGDDVLPEDVESQPGLESAEVQSEGTAEVLNEDAVATAENPSDAVPEEANPEPEKDISVDHAGSVDEPAEQEATTETQAQLERTLALIKPDAYGAGNKAAIIDIIKKDGFAIIKEKEITLTKSQAEEFYKEHTGKPFFEGLVEFMTSQPIYALILEKNNAIKAWRDLIGPTNSIKAKEENPQCIRALFGTDGSHNAVHGSDSVDSATREIKIVFSPSSTSASSNVSQSDIEQTLALIKPDAYGAGRKINIQKIIKKEGFTIVKEKEVRLTRLKAKEFYAEHDGKPFFEKLITWMSSAPVYAMVLRKEGAVKAWRDLMGPTNSVKAKEAAPKSIRALYGTDGSKNAVHGSDSFSSASREIKIVFGNADSASNGAKKPTRSPVMRAAPPNGSRATTTQAKPRPVSVSDATTAKRSVRPAAGSTTASATAPKRSSMPPSGRSPITGEQAKVAASKDGTRTRVPSTLRTATKPATTTTATSRTSAPKPAPTTKVSSVASSRKPVESKGAPAHVGPTRPVATRPRPSSAASKDRATSV
ncbi:hypothetical protein K7432_008496, partial [Basidiobolus ranarum]